MGGFLFYLGIPINDIMVFFLFFVNKSKTRLLKTILPDYVKAKSRKTNTP